MIRLHPIPDTHHTCTYCHVGLEVQGWYIPGMRNLAHLFCPQCQRTYYGDLPVGHGIYYPMLLQMDSGVVHDSLGVPWFSKWLRDSFAQRKSEPVNLKVEEVRPARKAILLNCLDALYGHCLLKLLNAQYYLDHRPDLGLIVLVPRFLRWLVPDGVASIWTVDLPLNRGTEWNDWIATEIHRRVEKLEECWISVAFSHPHPDDFDIERFSRVKPFQVDEWEKRLDRPTVTFIWREDRLWFSERRNCAQRIQKHLGRLTTRILSHNGDVKGQSQRVIALAELLKDQFAELDFAVLGLASPGGFPGWISDLRHIKPDDTVERSWCRRYASSHVVIGVHGSNMLLPSAHAGAVVELMPPKRWANVLQDFLLRSGDLRETLFRYRILPISILPDELVQTVAYLVTGHYSMILNMHRELCDHRFLDRIPTRYEARRQQRVPSTEANKQ